MEVGKTMGAPSMGASLPQQSPAGPAPSEGAGRPNVFGGLEQKTVHKTDDEKNMTIGDKLNQMAGIAKDDPYHKPKNEMGKDAFLKLFMEQLKQQDPLNPVKNDQFNAQMAQFSQLEQAVNMNKNLEKMIAQQSNTQLAALQLVGKDISADRGALYHETGKFTAMNFKLPQDMKEMNVEITDQAGQPIRTYKLENKPAGDMSFKWDGKDDQEQTVPTGKYSYKITGTGQDNKPVEINNKVEGRVSGVTNASGTVFLLVGEQKVALGDVAVIKESATAAAGAANSVAPDKDLPPGVVKPVTAKPVAANKSAGANQPSSEDMQKMMAQAQAAFGGKAAASKNDALSHDSFDDLPDGSSTSGVQSAPANPQPAPASDKTVAGTKPESNTTSSPNVREKNDDFDARLPDVMPPLAR